jgi:hypothetical protein
VHDGPQPPTALRPGDSKAFVKFTLMTLLVIASALLGDDAQLRAIDQSIGRWVTGRDSSFEPLRPLQAVKRTTAEHSPAQ